MRASFDILGLGNAIVDVQELAAVFPRRGKARIELIAQRDFFLVRCGQIIEIRQAALAGRKVNRRAVTTATLCQLNPQETCRFKQLQVPADGKITDPQQAEMLLSAQLRRRASVEAPAAA